MDWLHGASLGRASPRAPAADIRPWLRAKTVLVIATVTLNSDGWFAGGRMAHGTDWPVADGGGWVVGSREDGVGLLANSYTVAASSSRPPSPFPPLPSHGMALHSSMHRIVTSCLPCSHEKIDRDACAWEIEIAAVDTRITCSPYSKTLDSTAKSPSVLSCHV